ncbi:MAG: M20 family metallopeptidase [Anaerolineales bacterium]
MPPLTIDEARSHLPDLLEILRRLVEIESPTPEKLAVDRAGSFVAEQMEQLGASVQRIEQSEVGDHWLGSWGSGPGGILMMVHVDTVHPIGTLEHFPWSEVDGKIYGPGIMDMKASAAIALTAIRALRQGAGLPERRISLMFNSDEETGSHTSQELIQSQAKEHDLVLCLEPALPDAALKTWRKGIGMFEIEVEGRMAHAGANPSDGINAIHEIAHQIRLITELADEEAGSTLNIDLIEGGTRTNVIAAHARASIDIRVMTEEERSRVASEMDNLRPLHPEAKLSFSGEWNRPPMPRTEAMIRTFARAKEIGAGIGLELTEGGTGGGSDANFVAPLGVPVLDGLGAVGAGAHTEQEYIRTESLPERTALLAALLVEW